MILWTQVWTQAVPPEALGPVGVTVILLIAIVTLAKIFFAGKLISEHQYNEMKSEKDDRIKDLKERSMKWETAYENERHARMEERVQKEVAVEAALTAEKAFTALTEAVETRRK